MTAISVSSLVGLSGGVSASQAGLSALAANPDAATASDASVGQGQSGSPPSSIVSLGQSNATPYAPTYTASGIASNAGTTATATALVWQSAQGDAISSLMAANFNSTTLAGRFQGVGAALVDGLKSGAGNYSQAVLNPSNLPAVDTNSPTALAAMAQNLHQFTDNQITLNVETASGVSVSFGLTSQADGMAVQMSTGGSLTGNERAALEKLADAFQSAVDGVSATTPTLDLSGLTQFDPTVLQSVDLHVQLAAPTGAPQIIDFHADSAKRSVTMSGQEGSLQVSVDTSNPMMEGTQAQQQQAIAQYLQQFDTEAARGQANTSLMTMFKDAFSQMNSPYNVSPAQQSAMNLAPVTLQDQDHALLTGLADFSASVEQTPVESNAMHLDELDTFSYQVSQTTAITGKNELNRSISQDQQSNLQASYHAPLRTDEPLQPLTTDKKSQNYYYDQISDSASSNANIDYEKGHLAEANLTQEASQSTHARKYEDAQLVQDTTTPSDASQEQDFMAVLKPYLEDHSIKTPQQIAQWQQTLAAIHSKVFLQDDPGKIVD